MNNMFPIYKFLTESRRNPLSNPKENPWETFQRYYEALGSKLFISFTDLEKLGINIRSEYKTPLGIYSYPAEYVHSLGSINAVPFAHDAPYINFFTSKPSAHIIYLHTLSREQSEHYIKLAKDWYTDRSLEAHKSLPDNGKSNLVFQINQVFDIIEKEAETKFHSNPGAKLWYYTWKLTKFAPGDNASIWNVLFRKYLHIDGVVDYGFGTIHPNEPTQAVFFSTSAIQVIDRVKNVVVKSDTEKENLRFQGVLDAKLRNTYRNMTDDELLAHLDAFPRFTNPSERVQKAALDSNPKNLQYIKNPSPEISQYAVKAQAKIDIANMKKSFGW